MVFSDKPCDAPQSNDKETKTKYYKLRCTNKIIAENEIMNNLQHVSMLIIVCTYNEVLILCNTCYYKHDVKCLCFFLLLLMGQNADRIVMC